MAILLFGTILLLILAASCFLLGNALSQDAISTRQDVIMIESVIASQSQALQSFRAANPRVWPTAERLASDLPSYSNGNRRHYAAAPIGFQWSLYSNEGEVTFCLSPTSQPPGLSASGNGKGPPWLVQIVEKISRERPSAVIQVAASCTGQGVTCAEDQDFCRNHMADPRVLLHTIKRF